MSEQREKFPCCKHCEGDESHPKSMINKHTINCMKCGTEERELLEQMNGAVTQGEGDFWSPLPEDRNSVVYPDWASSLDNTIVSSETQSAMMTQLAHPPYILRWENESDVPSPDELQSLKDSIAVNPNQTLMVGPGITILPRLPGEMAAEFHEVYDCARPTELTPKLDEENAAIWKKMLDEERQEYYDAVEDGDIVEIADAIADQIYLLYGDAIAHGIRNMDAIVAEVHRSNMTKLLSNGEVFRSPEGKVLKGPHYELPRVRQLLGLTNPFCDDKECVLEQMHWHDEITGFLTDPPAGDE